MLSSFPIEPQCHRIHYRDPFDISLIILFLADSFVDIDIHKQVVDETKLFKFPSAT